MWYACKYSYFHQYFIVLFVLVKSWFILFCVQLECLSYLLYVVYIWSKLYLCPFLSIFTISLLVYLGWELSVYFCVNLEYSIFLYSIFLISSTLQIILFWSGSIFSIRLALLIDIKRKVSVERYLFLIIAVHKKYLVFINS